MTVDEVICEEAAKFGITLTREEANAIVWADTGFPGFWSDRDKTPEENLRAQLRDYFTKRGASTRSDYFIPATTHVVDLHSAPDDPGVRFYRDRHSISPNPAWGLQIRGMVHENDRLGGHATMDLAALERLRTVIDREIRRARGGP